jgi:hypothetical protein
MSVTIQSITAHFSQKCAVLHSVHVPEWGGTIYWKPATLEMRHSISTHAKNIPQYMPAYTVACMALNADETKMFRPADGVDLRKSADPDILLMVSNKMLGVDPDLDPELDADQQEKEREKN